MNKAEKIVIVIGLCSLVIGFLAWQFPVGNESDNSRLKSLDSVSRLVGQSQNTHYELGSESEKVEAQNIKNTDQAQPLVSHISFDLFLTQIRSLSPDSNQLSYASKTKEKLGGKLEFSELNLLIDEMSLDSNRIAMIKIFRDVVNKPTEKDMEILMNKFSLSSNKQKALDLLY